MNRQLSAALPAVVLCTAGCAVNVTAPDMVGEWGGEHISISVSLTESTVEYDCAHGTIDGPIAPDHAGKFTLSGTHVREHGGPIREDEMPDQHPARYSGWSNGDRMTLTVTLLDTGETIGQYELRLGSLGRVLKCL
jgi:hypothetical protein